MNALSAAAGETTSPVRRLAAADRLLRWERLLFAICVVALVVPVWLFAYVPTTDGPVHVNIAQILRDYDLPSAGLYRDYFVLNPNIEPNVTAHYLLAELGRVVDILTAEKLLLTGIILALCLGARYAVRAVSPAAAPFSFLFLPAVYSYFFNEGYYNFCLGLGLYLLAFGFWYARRDRLGVSGMAGLAALGLVVVWTHLIAFAMLALSLGIVTTVEYGLRWLREAPDRRRIAVGYARQAALLLLLFAPAMLFAFSFFDRHGLTESPAMEQDYAGRLKHLLSMSFLFTHSPWEIAILAPYLALVLVLGARNLFGIVRHGVRAGDAFLVLAILLAAIYMLLPVTTKGVEITERFLPYILFALLLWLASRLPVGRMTAVAVTVVAAVLAGSTVYHVAKFDRYEALIDEYVSAAAHVEPGSTLLALHFWRQDRPLMGERITWRSDPLRHISSHIARMTGGVDLRSYMMSIGYFPVRYRPAVDPYRTIGRHLEAVPPQVDLSPAGGGPRIDYVLTWAYPNEAQPPAEAREVMRRIEAGFELVYVSPENGLVRLFRRAALRRAPDPSSSWSP